MYKHIPILMFKVRFESFNANQSGICIDGHWL